MHMVTETYQLRDGEKLTEFYNGIDWESPLIFGWAAFSTLM